MRFFPYGDGVKEDGSPMYINGFDLYLDSGEYVCAVSKEYVGRDEFGAPHLTRRARPLVRDILREQFGLVK